jgi:HAD superfamily hydrolase (TIGR01509 family)
MNILAGTRGVGDCDPHEAVVFDCDGLLLDTEDCWSRGQVAMFARYGREFTPEDKRLFLGMSHEASGRLLAAVLDQPGREETLAEEQLALCWNEVVAGATPLPGAVELLDALRGRLPVGLASNSPRGLVEAALDTAGLADAFDLVLAGDEVSRPKPDPEIYVTVCRRLGAHPSRSVALEDSPTGVSAARAAGMFVIGIPSEPDVALDAHEVFDSLRHPTVRKVLTAGL